MFTLNILKINSVKQTIIKQGENGDCLYYVEEGNIECFKKFVKIVYNYFFYDKLIHFYNLTKIDNLRFKN